MDGYKESYHLFPVIKMKCIPAPKNHCTINIILTNIEQYHLLLRYFAQILMMQTCFIETAPLNPCSDQSASNVPEENQPISSEESEDSHEEDSQGDSSDSNLPKTKRKKKREVTDYRLSKEFRELNAEINHNLLRALKLQLKNNSALLRKATILLLEFIAKTKLNIDELLLSWVGCFFNDC